MNSIQSRAGLFFRIVLALCGFVVCSYAAEVDAENTLPDDPRAAWAEVEKGHQALTPPAAWRSQAPKPEEVAEFQKKIQSAGRAMAAKALEFLRRFPTDENVTDARFTVVYALAHAVVGGDLASEKQAQDFIDTTVADPALSSEDKAKVLMLSGNIGLMKKVGMRFFTEGQQKFHAEMDRAAIETLHEAKARFPKSEFIYTAMLALAERSAPEVQKKLSEEIANADNAPAEARSFARHLLNGTRPYQIGKPLDIHFTALDGREVDLAKLKGKVVLIDFWSTTCGPCIGQMPELKEVYSKYHDKGFEIVGISLDDKKSALERFIKEKELPWPQQFEGKGWECTYAVRYGVFGIPVNWLIDKKGNLRDVQARFRLGDRVRELLDE